MEKVPEENKKDFENWFKLKPKIDGRPVSDNTFFREGQIWWCSLGSNIGVEIDGKNEAFERPVLILPISSKPYNDRYHIPVEIFGKKSFVILSQIRAISSKRLISRLGVITSDEFKIIRIRLKEML